MARSINGFLLDTGALIAAERGDRRFAAIWKRALQLRLDVRVPTTVLAQAWRSPRQARMARLIKACRTEPLLEAAARSAGELCGRTGTSDIIDAHVVLVAHTSGYAAVTSDPGDLGKLADLLKPRPAIVDLNELSLG